MHSLDWICASRCHSHLPHCPKLLHSNRLEFRLRISSLDLDKELANIPVRTYSDQRWHQHIQGRWVRCNMCCCTSLLAPPGTLIYIQSKNRARTHCGSAEHTYVIVHCYVLCNFAVQLLLINFCSEIVVVQFLHCNFCCTMCNVTYAAAVLEHKSL